MKANLDRCPLLLSATEAFNFQISEISRFLEKAAGKVTRVTFDNPLLSESLQNEWIECSGKSDPLHGLMKKANINERIFQFSV